jgi:hypothetical protein
MKDYFTKYNTTRTESLLAKHGLKLDKYDGVISIVGKDSTENIGATLTISFREVLTSVTIYEDKINFNYETTKRSNFPKKKHLTIMSEEKWFELIEKIATSLALEVGLKEISLDSGRKDQGFIISKGYKRESYYSFYKDVDPSILHNLL